MKSSTILVALIFIMVSIFLNGCVTREIRVRSEPEGAPVWIDEEYAGKTPAEVPFKHYGHRRIAVGPIRDADGKTTHVRNEQTYNIKAPWYQKFPLDFFFEVLWPENIEDVHVITLKLKPSRELEGEKQEKLIQETLEEARKYREKADQPPDHF